MKHSAKILSLFMVFMMMFGALTIFTMMPTKVHAAGDTYELVTDANTLKAGDQLVFATNTKGYVMGNISSSIGASISGATFSADKKEITSLPSGAVVLTLGESKGAWTFANNAGKLLGATTVKKIAWDSGTTKWSISISNNGDATVQNATSTYGRFLYNVSSPRFTTYTSDTSASMLLIQIYRLKVEDNTCDHNWINGVCDNCNKTCDHEWSDSVCGICGSQCADHDWSNKDGICVTCNAECEHSFNIHDVCSTCGKKNYKDYTIATEFSDLKDGDIIAIAATANGTQYLMSNNNGTGSAPNAIPYTNGNPIPENCLWKVKINDGSYTFFVNGDSNKWLYCTDTNNGVRVGTNTNKTFVLDDSGYLKHEGTGRYLGVYTTTPDWRCYTTNTGNSNIAGQEFSSIAPCKFDSASLTLQDNLKLNFKIAASKLGDMPFKAIATFNGDTFEVDCKLVDGQYVFSISNIAPHQMNDEVSIYITFKDENGGVWHTPTFKYSVATYCYNMVNDAKLHDLVVSILNYGAAAQVAVGHNVEKLANSDLADADKVVNYVHEEAQSSQSNVVENASAVWTAAGLVLNDKIVVRFAIEAGNVDGLSVKVEVNGNVYKIDEFVSAGENCYYVYIEGLNATQLRDNVSVVVMKGDVAVSNTLTYSVAVYATKVLAYDGVEGYENLVNLVKAMMAYGDAAAAYAG